MHSSVCPTHRENAPRRVRPLTPRSPLADATEDLKLSILAHLADSVASATPPVPMAGETAPTEDVVMADGEGAGPPAVTGVSEPEATNSSGAPEAAPPGAVAAPGEVIDETPAPEPIATEAPEGPLPAELSVYKAVAAPAEIPASELAAASAGPELTSTAPAPTAASASKLAIPIPDSAAPAPKPFPPLPPPRDTSLRRAEMDKALSAAIQAGEAKVNISQTLYEAVSLLLAFIAKRAAQS